MTPSQQLASALVAVYRLMTDAPSDGRRKLFESVNEAFCYVAGVEHDARKAAQS